MKKRYRIAAALLALALLAGCSNPGGGTSSEGGSSSETTSASESSGETSQVAAEPGEVTLPLVDEKTTLTMWTPMDSNSSAIIDSMGDSEFFKELEERTNVHIEFDHPAVGNETQAFNLMISSGELPDMIKTSAGCEYPDGLDAAVNDGYFMDLTELAPQYLPNYLAAMEMYSEYDENFRRACYTNEGRLVAVAQVMNEPQGPFVGLYVRQDWLDDAGLDVPVTYDDWEEMLTTFKDKFGATSPLILPSLGYDSTCNSLNGGFGIGTSFYQEDGVIKFGPIEPGWKDYITLMKDWYAKGLIDPDFMTGEVFPDEAMISTGKTGAFISMYTLIAMYEGANEDPDATYVPVSAPKLNEGDTVKFNLYGIAGGSGLVLSAQNKNPELSLRWIDYLFSEEGSIFANYGIEGDTFEYNEEGEPEYTDKITANPDGLSFSQAMAIYTMPPARVCLQHWTRELASVPEKDLISYEIWPEATTENCIPSTSAMGMTVDENAEYAQIMADVNTLIEERTAQFITGSVSMDEFDTFVESLHSLNIERAIELVQTVYDRFMEK